MKINLEEGFKGNLELAEGTPVSFMGKPCKFIGTEESVIGMFGGVDTTQKVYGTIVIVLLPNGRKAYTLPHQVSVEVDVQYTIN